MVARVGIGVVGAIASIGLIISSLSDWVQTSVGSFSGAFGFGIPLAVAALAALSLHVVAAVGGSRWATIWGVVTGGAAVLVGIVVTVAVHIVDHSSSLLSALISRRSDSIDVATATHVSRAWGGTGLLIFGALLFVASLTRLALPSVGIASNGRPRRLRDQLRSELSEELNGSEAASKPSPTPAAASVPVDDLL